VIESSTHYSLKIMNSFNFVLLGGPDLARELGKKGTTSDISIYDRKEGNTITTWCIPLTYPDKIQSLVVAINIAEYAILNVSRLDKYLGEQIIALDHFTMLEGFILHSHDVEVVQLQSALRNTRIKNYSFMSNLDELKHGLKRLKPKTKDGRLLIVIDHVFDVKGVGTVVLGVIKQGKVKISEEVMLYPQQKTLTIKSIQMHDDSVYEASSPARVGLALKGVTANDISRGDVISGGDDLFLSSNIIPESYSGNPYFAEQLSETEAYLVSVDLQMKPAKIKLSKGGSPNIELVKPLVVSSKQDFVLLKPDAKGVRICGRGTTITT
jgi:selenocysteine-specific translation elongation factor